MIVLHYIPTLTKRLEQASAFAQLLHESQVKTIETHQHRKLACLEEIAYLNGWITKEDILEVYEVLKKNQYGQYLKDVLDGKSMEHLY